jgi:glutamyl-tRNA reductase
MPIVCVGVSHHSAPVALRERLAFTPGEQRALLATVGADAAAAGLGELAILSTCNRTELYAAADNVSRRFHEVPAALPALLAGSRDLSADALGAHLYARVSSDAVRHLCRVAAGLDSMMIGESEVLGQVAAAHELATRESAIGPVLDAAFRTAVRAGRRARTETGIGRHPTSVSTEAVRQLRELWGDLATARVLIVGTGQAGRLAGEALRKRGVHDLSVVSRTAEHAESLARGWHAVPLPWHALEAAIRDADVVISCTGAPHAVITRELVESALRGRAAGRPLLVADIAVPRDVEPAVRSLPLVRVLDLDDLQRRVDGNLAVRRREVPTVEAIVEDEVARFEEWRHGVELRPILAAMRAHGEAIRRREMEKALRRIGPVAPEVREQLDALTRSLVSKLLHHPTQRLRDETDPARRETYARATAELFGLEPAGDPADSGAAA